MNYIFAITIIAFAAATLAAAAGADDRDRPLIKPGVAAATEVSASSSPAGNSRPRGAACSQSATS